MCTLNGDSPHPLAGRGGMGRPVAPVNWKWRAGNRFKDMYFTSPRGDTFRSMRTLKEHLSTHYPSGPRLSDFCWRPTLGFLRKHQAVETDCSGQRLLTDKQRIRKIKSGAVEKALKVKRSQGKLTRPAGSSKLVATLIERKRSFSLQPSDWKETKKPCRSSSLSSMFSLARVSECLKSLISLSAHRESGLKSHTKTSDKHPKILSADLNSDLREGRPLYGELGDMESSKHLHSKEFQRMTKNNTGQDLVGPRDHFEVPFPLELFTSKPKTEDIPACGQLKKCVQSVRRIESWQKEGIPYARNSEHNATLGLSPQSVQGELVWTISRLGKRPSLETGRNRKKDE